MSSSLRPIPNQLRRYRMDRGLNQQEVAKLLGLASSGTLSRWEQGRSLPSAMNMLRLAALYRTLVDALYWDLIKSLRRELQQQDEQESSSHHDSQEI